jgi:hypothetical protein
MAKFDAAWSKTDVTMALPPRGVEGTDRGVRPDETEDREAGGIYLKVYIRRLQLCQDLYKYVPENKK